MSKMIRVLLATAILIAAINSRAIADWALTQGAGTTIFAFTGSGACVGKQCPAHALIDSAGAEKGVSGNPLSVTFPSAQAVSGTISGTGTAGSAATGVMTVQGIASMTPLFIQSATVPVSTMNSANANNGANVANAFVFDDTTPTAITENNFGFARMSANRVQYQTIRDAAGNERGVNVDASNRLSTALTSGAVASGAYASGAFASGSMAAGSMVDFLTTVGTKAAGTAAASSQLIGGVFNTTPPTLANGQQAASQLDSSGNLKVNVVAGGAGGGAITAASGAYASGSIASGAMVDLGVIADAASTAGGTGSVNAKLRLMTSQLDSINSNVQAPIANGTNDIGGVYNAGREYETVAASQTGQTLGPTGATGDYLSHCVVYPASTSPGVVTVFDNTTSATNDAIAFAGGATSLSNLVPISIPVGAISVNGAWKVTTGANVKVTCYGKFT